VGYHRERVKEIAEFFGWEIDEIAGDLGIIDSLLKCSKNSGTVWVEPNTKVSEDLWRTI
jgi:hypothetical protein